MNRNTAPKINTGADSWPLHPPPFGGSRFHQPDVPIDRSTSAFAERHAVAKSLS